MIQKRGKLRLNILFYFLLFTIIILSSVWIFQIGFMEGYFQTLAIKNLKNTALEITETKNKNEFDDVVTRCKYNDINVYVLTEQNELYFSNSRDFNAEMETIESVVKSLINSGNNESWLINNESNIQQLRPFVYATKYENYILVLTRSKENISETVDFLRWQFIIITVIILAIGALLAWYLSYKLSKPIDEMSAIAKKWANGDNTITFKTSSEYAEILELSNALNYAKDGLSKSGTLQRDLLANVSHDLKTPLTMIKAYAEMIKDISGENKEKRDKHTQVIIDEADRLTMLVNDILNLSKLQSSVEDIEYKEINLSELTERVISRFSDYVETKGYTIENHIAPDLLTVVDESKIEQVIYNLLGNSINYTGEDKTVKVYLTAENDKILLEIIDSGKGISDENMSSIWERYYRFSETNSRPVKGTGLGLSIVKTILDNHKLKFGIRTKQNCGSNFYVEFIRVKNNEQ